MTCALLLFGSAAAQANPFEISVGTDQIRVRSIGPKAVYSVGADIGYAQDRPERAGGPDFLAPSVDWSLARSDATDAEQAFSISFCDESGVLSQVFAVTGYLQLPALGITRAALTQQGIGELTPTLSGRRLFWRDRRDLDPGSADPRCSDPPALRQATVEIQASALPEIDAQPISNVMQLLAEDASGQPVARIVAITDLPDLDDLPPWVRQPLIWYLIGILLGVIALVLGLFRGAGRRV